MNTNFCLSPLPPHHMRILTPLLACLSSSVNEFCSIPKPVFLSLPAAQTVRVYYRFLPTWSSPSHISCITLRTWPDGNHFRVRLLMSTSLLAHFKTSIFCALFLSYGFSSYLILNSLHRLLSSNSFHFPLRRICWCLLCYLASLLTHTSMQLVEKDHHFIFKIDLSFLNEDWGSTINCWP